MTSVASFVLECAVAGRWRRGLMALQSSSTGSRDPAVRHASAALAVATVLHDGHAARDLLHPDDIRDETALVCGVVAGLVRSPDITSAETTAMIQDLLHGAAGGETTQTQALILLQALRWCSRDAADALCRDFPLFAKPDRAAAVTRGITVNPLVSEYRARTEALSTLCESSRQVYACLPLDHSEATPAPSHKMSVRPAPSGRRAREQARILAQRQSAAEAAATQRQQQAVLAAIRGRTHSAVLPAALGQQGRALAHQTTLSILSANPLRYPAATDLGVLLSLAARSVPPTRSSERRDATPSTPPLASSRPTPSLSASPLSSAGSASAPRAPPAPRPATPTVSWQLALGVTHAAPPLTRELFPLYLRCVGLRAPQLWATALHVADTYWTKHGHHSARKTEEGEVGQRAVALEEACLVLWMLSRGSWAAAIAFYHSTEPVLTTSSRMVLSSSRDSTVSTDEATARWQLFAEDCLSRTAIPPSVFLHAFPSREGATAPHRRPSVRLPEPTRRCVARALAAGLRLEEVQMSAVARHWAAGGHWRELLWLYERLPTEEFQRRAVQCLVDRFRTGPDSSADSSAATAAPKSASAVVEILAEVSASHHRRQRGLVPPPGTHTTWLLVRASRSPKEALRVFRRCINLGATCKPQLVSGLMDAGVARDELEAIMRHYPGAVNAGVRRRAAEEFNVAAP